MKTVSYIIVLALFMFSCKKDDPCEGVSCLNDGSCIDGTCFCVGLWTGKRCNEQIRPTLITMKGISVTKMPATDASGAGWDLTSGADIYVIVRQGADVLLDTSSDWRQNAGVGTSWNYTFSTLDTTTPLSIELWDFDDFDTDDYMGGINGFIYSDTNGFPTFEPFECAGCDVGFLIGPITYL